MEANEKNEILSKLYAIRAGMSSVSIEKDKVVSIDKKLEKAEKENKKSTKNLQSKIKEAKSTLRANKSVLNDKRKYPLQKRRIFWLTSGSAASFALLGGLLLFAPMVAVFLGVPSVICGGLLLKKSITEIVELNKMKQGGKRLVKRAPENILRLEAEIKEDTARLAKESEEFNRLQNKSLKSREESIEVAKNMYNVISREYKDMLDTRDWQHIDLIIFCFETGRADNIKEALLWVDRQVQTDQIISAVNNASAQIQNTIQNGFQKLHTDMVKCFSVISNQLDGIAYGINEISHGINEQNARVAELTKKVDLNNALLEKASLSSSELAKDVHYMRELAENKNLRKIGNP